MHGTFGRNVTFFCFSYEISSWIEGGTLKISSVLPIPFFIDRVGFVSLSLEKDRIKTEHTDHKKKDRL